MGAPDWDPASRPSAEVNGIPTSAILAELEALCTHPELGRAHRQTALLRYVVRAVLDGEGDQLKEYTIAIGALDKRADFDPTIDSSVRSEASRIRTKLHAIYAAEPEAHPIRIVLPKGTYRPTFERAPALAAQPGESTPPPAQAAPPVAAAAKVATLPKRRPTSRYAIPAALVLIAVGG